MSGGPYLAPLDFNVNTNKGMDPVSGAVIGQGLSIGADVLNNVLFRKRQLQDYERMKKDNREFWDIQNKYNSPEEQMNRLRQAGLNPNLVYGKGADNTAGAIMTSKMPEGSDRIVPKLDAQAYMQAKSMGQQLKYQQAQTDNVLQDTHNKEVQASLTEAQKNQTDVQTANILQNTATSQFQLEQAKRNADALYQKVLLENEATRIRNVVDLGRFELEQVKSASDKARAIQEIAESKQRVLTSQLQNKEILPLQKQKLQQEIEQLTAITVNTNLEGAIKQVELELRQKGISPSDPYYFRKVWEGLTNLKEEAPNKVMKYMWGVE